MAYDCCLQLQPSNLMRVLAQKWAHSPAVMAAWGQALGAMGRVKLGARMLLQAGIVEAAAKATQLHMSRAPAAQAALQACALALLALAASSRSNCLRVQQRGGLAALRRAMELSPGLERALLSHAPSMGPWLRGETEPASLGERVRTRLVGCGMRREAISAEELWLAAASAAAQGELRAPGARSQGHPLPRGSSGKHLAGQLPSAARSLQTNSAAQTDVPTSNLEGHPQPHLVSQTASPSQPAALQNGTAWPKPAVGAGVLWLGSDPAGNPDPVSDSRHWPREAPLPMGTTSPQLPQTAPSAQQISMERLPARLRNGPAAADAADTWQAQRPQPAATAAVKPPPVVQLPREGLLEEEDDSDLIAGQL